MKPSPDTCSGAFAHAMLEGFSHKPRRISPKWFYDAEGSRLFDAICELPEYYPTRTEIALLDRHGPDIARRIGPGAEIVEFGAGSLRKIRLLLDALNKPAGLLPIDISAEHLHASAASLQRDHPRLAIHPLAADFTQDLVLPAASGPRVGFFPGSSIGNFEPDEALQLLKRMANWLDGGLLIGVDLVKEPDLLHAAYNDAQGVTARFNRNLLARANVELGADFELARWAHSAFYHPALQRIEMHLVSRSDQVLHLCGQAIAIREGDSVHTENSYKYTVAGFQQMAEAAGFRPDAVWVDVRRWFALHWLRPA